ncbi:sensor histidine kinase [Alishewanella tabrizica]|uniref:histidine kinase n=1 Tax=Alishewanella tabrizica TaxID=671278 RepID=A0ABQ2WJD7_9ALTE|nr:HAMP domain-containing sensor histidine kinase [Alishewanella tabrizica]GGW55079.1 two-component sensor histidine kinase [Alishewanella tabrizica]
MNRRSLRKRVAFAFALCMTLLSVLWGFAFFAAIKLSEDRVVVNQLQRAVEHYPELTADIRGYDDIASLPESLQVWAQTHPDEGIYEFEPEELHVAVFSVDNAQRRAFVVFDVAGIEAASSEDGWWFLLIAGVVGTLGMLGFVLGMMVMGRVIAPVAQLAHIVADIDLAKLSTEDAKRISANQFGDNEVGVLAETIEKTLQRISAFIAREREFTDSVSHELRTPVTVIMGALELLEHSALSTNDVKALDRIKRATLDIKTTIELFLCLAREANDGVDNEVFLVWPQVNKAIEQQRFLLDGKRVAVQVDELAAPEICGHAQAFSIAVNNLVRNAFEYTLDGQEPITVCIKPNELIIINPVSNDDTTQCLRTETVSTHGYGLGLGIVQRLCERHGWSFLLLSQSTHVEARLSWPEHDTKSLSTNQD